MFLFFVSFFMLLQLTNAQCPTQLDNDCSTMCKANLTDEEYKTLFPENVDKYIFASWKKICGGLGNQMYRFASLYGIGKPYGRMPIFTNDQKCIPSNGYHESEGEHEIEDLFPVYASQIKFINATKEESDDTFYIEGFSTHCCIYKDPKNYKIEEIKQKYLKIEGYYFQSYQYFVNWRKEIRQIFQFGPKLCKKVEAQKKDMFKDDKAHKFCVHTRTGDFKFYGWESKKEFTEEAIEYGFDYLKKNFNEISQISLILMGADKPFLNDLEIDRELFLNVYIPGEMLRADDLAFGALACDSLLITAQVSTFSHWIAYLMPNNATIFYNSNHEGTPVSDKNFLPEWVPILINGAMTSRIVQNSVFIFFSLNFAAIFLIIY